MTLFEYVMSAALIGIFLIFYLLFRNLKNAKKESVILLDRLNSSSLPATATVDNFAAERNIVCTRFQVPAAPLSGYSQYLSVFLGNNEYNYFLKDRKWILR